MNMRQHMLVSSKKAKKEEEAQEWPKNWIKGKNVCVTGKMGNLNRRNVRTAIRRLGGIMHDNVKYNTHYLAVGKRPGRIKQREAEAHRIKTVPEHIFLEQMRRVYNNA